MANKTPFLKPLKMEELIERVRSSPSVYNQTEKIHKKLYIEKISGRPIYIAYPSGQGLKLTLYRGQSAIIATSLLQIIWHNIQTGYSI